jgi:hypothetical protein
MPKCSNLVVAQTGGPAPVINSSLRGTIEGARDFGQIGTVYGARHGNEGVLKEELIDLGQHAAMICGQESGTKKEFLKTAASYEPRRALMIGDAPGDYEAARANGALFFPINPGAEEASWKRFFEEGIERFVCGTFAGAYEEALLAEFDRHLPECPPWPVDE